MRFNDLVLKYGEDYKHWKEADIKDDSSENRFCGLLKLWENNKNYKF